MYTSNDDRERDRRNPEDNAPDSTERESRPNNTAAEENNNKDEVSLMSKRLLTWLRHNKWAKNFRLKERPKKSLTKSKSKKSNRNNNNNDNESDNDSEEAEDVEEVPPEPQSGLQRLRRQCGDIVEDPYVEVYFVILIFLNAACIGMTTFDFIENDPYLVQVFDVVNLVFLAIFTFELICQLIYLGTDLFKQFWLTFDFFIISLSWIFDVVQVLRSLVVIRAFRVMRALLLVSKLRILREVILTIASIRPRVTAILALLLLVMYIFAVLFTELFGHIVLSDGVNYFGSVDKSLFTCVEFMTLEWAEIGRELNQQESWAWAPIICYLFISHYVFYNLIIAVLCDAVSVVNDTGVDKKKERKELKKKLSLTSEKGSIVLEKLEKIRENQLRARFLLSKVRNTGVKHNSDALAKRLNAKDRAMRTTATKIGDFDLYKLNEHVSASTPGRLTPQQQIIQEMATSAPATLTAQQQIIQEMAAQEAAKQPTPQEKPEASASTKLTPQQQIILEMSGYSSTPTQLTPQQQIIQEFSTPSTPKKLTPQEQIIQEMAGKSAPSTPQEQIIRETLASTPTRPARQQSPLEKTSSSDQKLPDNGNSTDNILSLSSRPLRTLTIMQGMKSSSTLEGDDTNRSETNNSEEENLQLQKVQAQMNGTHRPRGKVSFKLNGSAGESSSDEERDKGKPPARRGKVSFALNGSEGSSDEESSDEGDDSTLEASNRTSFLKRISMNSATSSASLKLPNLRPRPGGLDRRQQMANMSKSSRASVVFYDTLTEHFNTDREAERKWMEPLLNQPSVFQENVETAREYCGHFVNMKMTSVVVTILIFLNSIILGLATFELDEETQQTLERFDNIILIIFTVEISMQLFYHGWAMFKDGFLCFDFIVIALSWGSLIFAVGRSVSVLRGFRIVRAFRLITKLDILRDLMLCLSHVIPRIGIIASFLLLIFYIFSVFYVDVFGEYVLEEEYFTTLPDSIFTCIEMMSLEWSGICREIMQEISWAWAPIILFVMISHFVLFNLIIAVLSDTVDIIDETHEEIEAKKDLNKKIVKEAIALRAICKRLSELVETEIRMHNLVHNDMGVELKRLGMGSLMRLKRQERVKNIQSLFRGSFLEKEKEKEAEKLKEALSQSLSELDFSERSEGFEVSDYGEPADSDDEEDADAELELDDEKN